ncbi:sugar ABC transporter substrate-binding protein, partial [Streptomyces sp. NPDC049577]
MSAVLAAVLGATLAGCSSTGGKRAEERAAAQAAEGRAAVNTPKWTFAMVTHSGDGDNFWDIVQ